MKKLVKHYLTKYHMFQTFDILRRLPQIVGWLRGGCRGVAPPPVKRMVISAYLKSYEIKNFVETGTHLGDTLAYVSQGKSIQAESIELDDVLYHAAGHRFRGRQNVTLLHGDSGQIMSEIVDSLRSPAMFWLDGHYSGASTARGDRETPVSAELQAIISSPVSGHVILIDDVRCFDGTHDYPHLDELFAVIRADGRYNIEISADILRLTPKCTNHEKDTY